MADEKKDPWEDIVEIQKKVLDKTPPTPIPDPRTPDA